MNGNQYRLLWAEVIARAVVDGNHGNKQALRFFLFPETYHEICEGLELSADVVKRIREHAIWNTVTRMFQSTVCWMSANQVIGLRK